MSTSVKPAATVGLKNDPEALRNAFVEAMGRAATGVTVVGTDGPSGRYARTVSAMCSVTADPTTLLVCVNRKSPLDKGHRQARRFLRLVARAPARPRGRHLCRPALARQGTLGFHLRRMGTAAFGLPHVGGRVGFL